MKPDTISLRRRHLMMAGLAGVAAPFIAFAEERAGAPRVGHGVASEDMQKLVISGRVLGAADGKPLAGATVEAWTDSGLPLCAGVASDADGRFMFAASAPSAYSGAPRHVRYRVSYNGQATPVTELQFDGGSAAAPYRVAHLQRDESGVWRGSFGVTLV